MLARTEFDSAGRSDPGCGGAGAGVVA
jgi:hypothetical protein